MSKQSTTFHEKNCASSRQVLDKQRVSWADNLLRLLKAHTPSCVELRYYINQVTQSRVYVNNYVAELLI
ncbi:hypothetical protein BgiMline_002123, partial [Biomphalaria glabrata]